MPGFEGKVDPPQSTPAGDDAPTLSAGSAPPANASPPSSSKCPGGPRLPISSKQLASRRARDKSQTVGPQQPRHV